MIATTDAERWALEFSRANALEREVERLKAESRQAQIHFTELEEDRSRLRRQLDDALRELK